MKRVALKRKTPLTRKPSEGSRKGLGLHKVRKTSRASVVRKLDKAVSAYIIKRDKKCITCGSTDQPTNGHLFSRIAYSTRWEITEDGNNHRQCWPCNYKHEFDPYPYMNWYRKKFGEDALEALHERHRTPVKLTTAQLEAMLEGLQAL